MNLGVMHKEALQASDNYRDVIPTGLGDCFVFFQHATKGFTHG